VVEYDILLYNIKWLEQVEATPPPPAYSCDTTGRRDMGSPSVLGIMEGTFPVSSEQDILLSPCYVKGRRKINIVAHIRNRSY
jgi:hypothetical protein